MKTLLEESSRVRARQVRQTVEFTVKLLRIRRSLEQHDRLCWPVREHSNESWNLFVKRSILTDRPWVSEDVYSAENLENSTGPFSR